MYLSKERLYYGRVVEAEYDKLNFVQLCYIVVRTSELYD
jgi:hypothetical protein